MVFIPNVNVPVNTEVFFPPDKLTNADQIGARGNDHWCFSASDSEMVNLSAVCITYVTQVVTYRAGEYTLDRATKHCLDEMVPNLHIQFPSTCVISTYSSYQLCLPSWRGYDVIFWKMKCFAARTYKQHWLSCLVVLKIAVPGGFPDIFTPHLISLQLLK